MKKIKLKFVGFTSQIMVDGLKSIILKHYIIEESDNPDYVIYWVYDYEHYKYDCVRILYTSECYTPDFNECDYAIGFDRLNFGDRYIRVPLYTLFQYTKLYDILKRPRSFTLADLQKKTGFCNFVVSNCFANDKRLKIFEKISEYKRVDSGGRFKNNIGGAIKDKFEFQKQYKFSIAGENCSYDGYATEKIVDAFAAGTVPIYFGDPNISKDFNSKSFINANSFDSLDDLLEYVKKIDNDDELYLSMLNQPILNSDAQIGDIEKFFCYIFDQPIESANRRSKSQVSKSYELSRNRYRFFEKKILKYVQKAINQIYRLKTGTLLTSKRTK